MKIQPPPTFREALRMPRPSAWRRMLGQVLPLPDVVAWEVREEMLGELAGEYARVLDTHCGPCTNTVVWLMDRAGRDHAMLERELLARMIK